MNIIAIFFIPQASYVHDKYCVKTLHYILVESVALMQQPMIPFFIFIVIVWLELHIS